jgi:deazaflavin-dependent oxidoreductase (nitroreductase family)
MDRQLVSDEPQFLYLTTTGWRSQRPHRIEIWFTSLDGRYYVISELGERAHWVRNLSHSPAVTVELGGQRFAGTARTLSEAEEPDLIARVRARSIDKYGWGDGLIVEIRPDPPLG